MFVASFLLGTKGSDKAAKAGSLSGKAGELGEVAGEAGKLGEVASGLGKVGELSLPRWMAEVSEPFRGLSKPVQATGDLTELMRSATAGQSALAEATEGVAKLTGGRAEIAPLVRVKKACSGSWTKSPLMAATRPAQGPGPQPGGLRQPG